MKPILFNTEMIKAILEGKKTVTRRAIKLDLGLADTDKNDNSYLMIPDTDGDYHHAKDYCKYKVGDILYVRETFNGPHYQNGYKNPSFLYKADLTENIVLGSKWKPSIHMPKEAARIFLEVTDVRVERLKNITFQDIKNEGVKATGSWDCVDYLEAFEELWNSTVKKQDIDKYGWESNPFVWVVEFEKINS